MTRSIFVAALALVTLLPGTAGAQSDAGADGVDRPTIALVLSGGSAKGLAHIGAIQVFEEEGIPFDIVAGTSAGSLVGSLYAVGYTGRQLEAIVTQPGLDLNDLFFDRLESGVLRLEERRIPDETIVRFPLDGFIPSLPEGVVAGQRAIQFLSRHTWGFHQVTDLTTLPRPFICNAVDLISGQDVMLTTGYLPEVVRACISLPGFFRPMLRDSLVLVDGGPSHMVPVPEALALGGEVLIGVDVSGDVSPEGEVRLTPEGNPTDLVNVLLGNQGVSRRRAALENRAELAVVVDPDVSGLSANDYGNAAEFIERGRRAARQAVPELRALMARLGNPEPRTVVEPPSLEPVQVARLDLRGVDETEARVVRHVLGLQIPGLLGPTPLEHPDRVGVGFRYDDVYDAALLFTIELRNRLRYGSTTGLVLRLGGQTEIGASYFTRLGTTAPVTLGAEIGYANAPVRFVSLVSGSLPEDDDDRPLLSQGLLHGRLSLGYALSNAALIGIRGKAGFYRETVEDYPITDAELLWDGTRFRAPDYEGAVITGRYYSGAAFLEAESFDRKSFPTRGYRVRLKAEFGTAARDDDDFIARIEDILGPLPRAPGFDTFQEFRHYTVDIEGALPVGSALAALGRVAYARGEGDGLPLSYLTSVGGIHTTTVFPGSFYPLYGMKPQARLGSVGWMARLGLQLRIAPKLFARVFANTGDAYEDLTAEELEERPDLAGIDGFDLDRAAFGVGLDLGWASPIGPATASIGWAEGESPRVGVGIGYAF
ncbi:MAG: patatin-like phospholipase family protein [Gemmatimonadota bacterium]